MSDPSASAAGHAAAASSTGAAVPPLPSAASAAGVPPSSASASGSLGGAAWTPPRQPTFVERMIAPSARPSSSLFRLMNPELFVERSKKVSASGWLVTAMVGFVVVTIGYTQWDYSRTTAQADAEARERKLTAREQRKLTIWRQLDAEEGVVVRKST